MNTYTNVVFSREERQTIKQAVLHLGITFPEVYEAAPKKKQDRPEMDARVMLRLADDPNLGTHANCLAGRRVLEALLDQCERESNFDYWLAKHIEDGHAACEESTEPTSAWMQYKMVAEIRGRQAEEVQRALSIVDQAARVTTAPAYDHQREPA